jgi:hypothetical protein
LPESEDLTLVQHRQSDSVGGDTVDRSQSQSEKEDASSCTSLIIAIPLIAVIGSGGLSSCSLNDSQDANYGVRAWEDAWLDGNASLRAGSLPEARRNLELAVSEAESLGGDHLRLGISLDRLARACRASLAREDALRHFRRALRVYKKGGSAGASDQLIAKESIGSSTEIGEMLKENKQYGDAEQSYRQAISIAERLGGLEMTKTYDKLVCYNMIRSLIGLAYTFEARNRNSEAENVYMRALRLNQTIHAPLAITDELRNRYLKVLSRQGKSLDENVLADMGLPTKSDQTLALIVEQWVRLQRAGEEAFSQADYPRAVEMFESAIKSCAALKPGDPHRIKSLGWLIKTHNRTQAFLEAEKAIDRSKTIFESMPVHKEFDSMLGEASRTYDYLHNPRGIENALQRKIKTREALFGVNDHHVAETLYQLGEVYYGMGNRVQAEFVLRRALTILTRDPRPEGHLRKDIEDLLSRVKLAY